MIARTQSSPRGLSKTPEVATSGAPSTSEPQRKSHNPLTKPSKKHEACVALSRYKIANIVTNTPSVPATPPRRVAHALFQNTSSRRRRAGEHEKPDDNDEKKSNSKRQKRKGISPLKPVKIEDEGMGISI